ncbi:MAG: hypothetical protein JWN85_3680 [Gammaproteobacteria bacterium]|nr:hypothetical protein [Gammaproteobacteria bacterium]
MRSFHCTHCQHLVFFENVRCLNCDHALAYLPDQRVMAALQKGPDELWRVEGQGGAEQSYHLCVNYERESICNWAVPASEPETLCTSCRLTRVIPNLANPDNKAAWYRLELAKRRLIYTLLDLELPLVRKREANDTGLAFEFLEDPTSGDRNRVLTGHDNGLITINIAEADDVRREQQRQQQHEPYRTLLGHFRHEIGHYYWDRLIPGSSREDEFRKLFGDERTDYSQALARHYASGPPAGWENDFISAYATSHPWEDWAETWAHFLHMTDALETAGAAGMSLRPARADEPSMATPPAPLVPARPTFDRMIADWIPLTYVLNNLNRGLGLPDGYPFVLSSPVIAKLRFIYDTIGTLDKSRAIPAAGQPRAA